MDIKEVETYAELKRCESGSTVRIRSVLKDIVEEPTKSGNTMIRIKLHDGFEPYSFCLFDRTYMRATEQFEINQIYVWYFKLGVYGAGNTVVIRSLINADLIAESLEDTKRFKPWSFARLTDSNYHMFQEWIGLINNPKYVRYIEIAYGLGKCPEGVSEDRYAARSKVISSGFGSINRHDSYPGGYTNHVMGLLRIAQQLKAIYGTSPAVGRVETVCNVDWDYVYAGCYLHDIGKPSTYAPISDGTARYREGTQVTHNVAGCLILSQVHNEVEPSLRLDYMEYQNFLYTIQFHDVLEKLYAHKRIEDKIIQCCDGLDAALVDSLQL